MPEARMHAKLIATLAVTDLVAAARIRPIRDRQGATGSHITYQRVGTDAVNHSTGGCDVAFARVQVDSWAETYIKAKAIAAVVKAALQGWTDGGGTPVVSMCHWIGDYDLPEGMIDAQDAGDHRVIQEYMIQYAT